jgi:hypothetical protein
VAMSTTSSDKISTACWLQIVPVWSRWYPLTLSGIRVRHVTLRKPKSPDPGCLLARVMVTIPRAAFVPPELAAEVELGHEHLEHVPLTVEPT